MAGGIEQAAQIQQNHYDKKLAEAYLKNLAYPHTREYFRYLDGELKKVTGKDSLGITLDLCCGHGEVEKIFTKKVKLGFGVDISGDMLALATRRKRSEKFAYLQASGLSLPFPNQIFDHVFCLGGIHHVPNRELLFKEIVRVLRRGGRLIFREPADDFFLWRGLRKIIYLISPKLDHKTERPVRRAVLQKELSKYGLRLTKWETKGFLGCAIFMNSDVLVFNRILRFFPGIKAVVRRFAQFDEWVSQRKSFVGKGIQAVGEARKT